MLGHGTTLAFSAATGFIGEILSLNRSGIERTPVPTTHFGTTGGKTFVPSDTYDPGELVLEMVHQPDVVPPIVGAAGTLTITWPTGSETEVFSGFLVGYEETAADEEQVRGTARFKASGAVSWSP